MDLSVGEVGGGGPGSILPDHPTEYDQSDIVDMTQPVSPAFSPFVPETPNAAEILRPLWNPSDTAATPFTKSGLASLADDSPGAASYDQLHTPLPSVGPVIDAGGGSPLTPRVPGVATGALRTPVICGPSRQMHAPPAGLHYLASEASSLAAAPTTDPIHRYSLDPCGSDTLVLVLKKLAPGRTGTVRIVTQSSYGWEFDCPWLSSSSPAPYLPSTANFTPLHPNPFLSPLNAMAHMTTRFPPINPLPASSQPLLPVPTSAGPLFPLPGSSIQRQQREREANLLGSFNLNLLGGSSGSTHRQ